MNKIKNPYHAYPAIFFQTILHILFFFFKLRHCAEYRRIDLFFLLVHKASAYIKKVRTA